MTASPLFLLMLRLMQVGGVSWIAVVTWQSRDTETSWRQFQTGLQSRGLEACNKNNNSKQKQQEKEREATVSCLNTFTWFMYLF